jgi:hypothetical protein
MVYYGVYYDAAVFFTVTVIPVLWSPKVLVKKFTPSNTLSKAVTGVAGKWNSHGCVVDLR